MYELLGTATSGSREEHPSKAVPQPSALALATSFGNIGAQRYWLQRSRRLRSRTLRSDATIGAATAARAKA